MLRRKMNCALQHCKRTIYAGVAQFNCSLQSGNIAFDTQFRAGGTLVKWLEFVGGSLATLGGGLAMAYLPAIAPGLATYGVVGGAVLLLVGLGLGLLGLFGSRVGTTPMADRKIGDITVSMGSGNQVGHIGHNVTIGHQPKIRVLEDSLKAALLTNISRAKPVRVLGMNGNTESMNFANQIHAFLGSSGFKMESPSATWHMFFEPPVFNININDKNPQTWIVVGPAE